MTDSTDPPVSAATITQSILVRVELLRKQDRKARKVWGELGTTARRTLATAALGRGWTNDDVQILLQAHAQTHNEPADDYSKIISDAQVAVDQDTAIGKLVELQLERKDRMQADAECYKREVLRWVSAALGLAGENSITRVNQYLSEPREYELVFSNCSISVGGIERLTTPRSLQLCIVDSDIKTLIPEFRRTSEKWKTVAQGLRDACTEISAGEESTAAGLARSWLRAYIAAYTILPCFDPKYSDPFVDQGCVFVYMNHVREYVRKKLYEQAPQKEFLIAMRRAGAEPVKFNAKRKKTSRQAWRLPQAEFPPPEPEVPAINAAMAVDIFIAESLIVDPGAVMSAGAVRQAYGDYCEARHIIKPVSVQEIAAGLRRNACVHEHKRYGDLWHGVRPKGSVAIQ